MRLRLLALFALFASTAAGQTTEPVPLTGTVENVTGRQVFVRSGNHSVMVLAGDQTTVWKGATFHDLLALRPGDSVRMQCYRNASGQLMASGISAAVTFAAVIRSLHLPDRKRWELHGRMEVLVDLGPGPSGDPRMESRIIVLTSATTFGAEDLAPGTEVHITGWDLGNGRVEAATVAIYNTDLPLRMPSRS